MNVDYLLTYTSKEDDFEEGYNGNLQFIIAVSDTTADNSRSPLIEAYKDANAPIFAPFTPTTGNFRALL